MTRHACTVTLSEPGRGEVDLHLSFAAAGVEHPEPPPSERPCAWKEAPPPGGRGNGASGVGAAPSGGSGDGSDSADPMMEPGTLRVHLQGAKELPPMDKDGGSDPYAKLSLLGQSFRSKTVKKTLTPLWDQTFEFSCVRGALRTETLKLAVYDWDQGSLDDLIGRAAVDLSPLATMKRHKCEVELFTKNRVAESMTEIVEGGQDENDAGGGAGGSQEEQQKSSLRKLSSSAKGAVKGVIAKPFVRMTSAGGAYRGKVSLSLSWEGQQSEMLKWLQSVGESAKEVVAPALFSFAQWVIDPLGEDDDEKRPLGGGGGVGGGGGGGGDGEVPSWARRRYYVICWDGPRAGECSTETFALGRLAHMYESGHLPEKVEVWPADGDARAGWRRIRMEIEEVRKRAEAP